MWWEPRGIPMRCNGAEDLFAALLTIIQAEVKKEQ